MQAYAPELNKRCRPHLKPTNKNYSIDETYIREKAKTSIYIERSTPQGKPSISLIGSMDNFGSAQRERLTFAGQVARRDMPQIVVDHRGKRVQRLFIAASPAN